MNYTKKIKYPMGINLLNWNETEKKRGRVQKISS